MENSIQSVLTLPRDILGAHQKPETSASLLQGTSIRRLTVIQMFWLLVLIIPGTAAGFMILMVKGTLTKTVPGGPTASPGEMLLADAVIFFIAWIIYLFMVSLGRAWSLRFLGDAATNVQVFRIAWIAAWPLISIAAFLRLVAVLIPASAPPAVVYAQFAMSMILFLAGLFLEARYSVRLHRLSLGQNTGRAFTTWISPFVIWFVFSWLIVQILGIFA